MTKNTDVDEYKYSKYGIAFDGTSHFSFPVGGNDQNVIIFGVDMNSSIHIDNKGKDISILGKGPTQRWTFVDCGKNVFVNFSKDNTKFCLSLHYNGANS